MERFKSQQNSEVQYLLRLFLTQVLICITLICSVFHDACIRSVFPSPSDGMWATPGDLCVQGSRVRSALRRAGHRRRWHSDCGPCGESSVSGSIHWWEPTDCDAQFHTAHYELYNSAQLRLGCVTSWISIVPCSSYDGLVASGNHRGSWGVLLLRRCAAEEVSGYGLSGCHGEKYQQPETLFQVRGC